MQEKLYELYGPPDPGEPYAPAQVTRAREALRQQGISDKAAESAVPRYGHEALGRGRYVSRGAQVAVRIENGSLRSGDGQRVGIDEREQPA